MNDLILISGATGFIGSAVARKLLARGFVVRAFIRPNSNRARLAGLDLQLATGDLCDPVSVQKAMEGVRWVFHVAADYRLWARDPTEIYRSNVDGTRTVMQAAMQASVERVIHTSSVATIRPATGGQGSDETMPLQEAEAIGTYKQSKVLAERVVETFISRGLPAVIVNPSTPVGPGDVKPTPTGRIVIEAAAGRIPAFVKTGLNLVHVDDVAEGHLLALEHGRIGERYILGGQNVQFAEFLRVVSDLTGVRPPRYEIPRSVVAPIALVAELIAQRTGREPFITRDGLRMSKNLMYFVSAKAERELGYRARPFWQGIEDAIVWFRQNGYLERAPGILRQ